MPSLFTIIVADRIGGIPHFRKRPAIKQIHHDQPIRSDILGKKAAMSGCFLHSLIKTTLAHLYTEFAVLFGIADSESLCQDAQKYISGEISCNKILKVL